MFIFVLFLCLFRFWMGSRFIFVCGNDDDDNVDDDDADADSNYVVYWSYGIQRWQYLVL